MRIVSLHKELPLYFLALAADYDGTIARHGAVDAETCDALSVPQIGAIIDDLAHYRYSDMEIAAFLISSASFVTSDELLALTHAMAQAGVFRRGVPTPIGAASI